MEAALLAFAEKGFDGVGIREIAQKASVNSALVQYHFGGKDGLYVESMRWIHTMIASARPPFPVPPSPEDPLALEKAQEALRGHIRLMVDELITCHGGKACLPVSQEVAQAAMDLWHREMELPRPSMVEHILQVIRPFQDHLQACLRILRPDLDETALELMGLSVHGQLLFMHKHTGLIHLVRGRPYDRSDLARLQDHFTQFSLRGIGLPDALPPQGA
jgi:AcrR family transcriptional regulator